MILIAISLALLVIVAGMFLLAKTKKDDLGSVFRFTSYFTITIGVLLVLGSICGGLCKLACHIHGGSDKAAYHQSIGQSKCSSGGHGCSSTQSFSGKKCAGGDYEHGSESGISGHPSCKKAEKACKSKCSSHEKKCSKKSSSCKMSGKKKIIKKIIKTDDDEKTSDK